MAINITLPADEAHLLETEGAVALESKLVNSLSATTGRCRAIQDKASSENRDLTTQEAGTIDRLLNQCNEIENRLSQLQWAVKQSATPPPAALGSWMNHSRRTGTGPLYNQMFPQVGGGTNGFRDFGDFCLAVSNRDPRLFNNISNSAGMQSSIGSEGGFYIPPGFMAGLLDDSLQQEAVRPRSNVVPMTTSQLTLPLFDLSNRSTGIAGLEGKVTGEGENADLQKAKIGQTTLIPHKYVVLVPTTLELVSDAPEVFASLLKKYMAEAIAATLDFQFLQGNGAGQALGIINAPSTVVVAKEGSQAADSVLPENLVKMLSRLAPGSFGKAVWLVNSSVLPQLFLLSLKVKNVAGTENVGGSQPGWFNVDSNGAMSLFGRPMIVSDRCPVLGDKGDIVLADFSQYLIGLREGGLLDVDTSLGFRSAEIYFRLIVRATGQPALGTPITPKVGSDTLSPFVVLAERA